MLKKLILLLIVPLATLGQQAKRLQPGKMLTTYAIQGDGSKETSVNLCPEGSFKADISKKGTMKNLNPEYKGKLTGTWTVEGMGEKGKRHLEFKKRD